MILVFSPIRDVALCSSTSAPPPQHTHAVMLEAQWEHTVTFFENMLREFCILWKVETNEILAVQKAVQKRRFLRPEGTLHRERQGRFQQRMSVVAMLLALAPSAFTERFPRVQICGNIPQQVRLRYELYPRGVEEALFSR